MLRIIGVNMEESTLLLGDNKSVVLNTPMPSSVLKKKHCVVSYHRIREAVASGIVKFSHIDSVDNYSDMLTKHLSANAFHRLIKPLLFRDPPREK